MKLVVLAVTLLAARADAKGCHEHSDVVGFQHCSHFGEWSPDDPQDPRLWLELGDLTERFVAPAVSFATGTGVEGAASHVTSTAVALRVLYAPDAIFYVGGELAFGGLVELSEQLPRRATDDGAMFVSARVITGAHVIVRRFGFAAELASGLRHYDISACIDDDCMANPDVGHTQLEVDARVRVDFFFSRMGSVGVVAGNGLVDRSDHEAMVMLAVHMRAMDGN
ncbi:MAG TPA: hypothetical protein VH143_28340 [Kofleriaceae bacterium]|nr:hypothetical protein [Kofleriaceae bacterium]